MTLISCLIGSTLPVGRLLGLVLPDDLRSSERPAATRDHWSVRRPLARNALDLPLFVAQRGLHIGVHHYRPNGPPITPCSVSRPGAPRTSPLGHERQ